MASVNVLHDLTETLLALLRAGLAPLVTSTNVRTATPDDFKNLGDAPTLTVFLYRVGVNAEMRNGPFRVTTDGKRTRPPLPLEVSYLLTPWVKEPAGAYKVAGRVLQTLYDRAELAPADLLGDSWSGDDTVQLILESLPLEDHLRLWDTTELPYRMSLSYTARVIGLDPAEQIVVPPVLTARFGAIP